MQKARATARVAPTQESLNSGHSSKRAVKKLAFSYQFSDDQPAFLIPLSLRDIPLVKGDFFLSTSTAFL